MAYKLVEPHKRNRLAEGKDYGMAFAMAKKEENVITCCQAITCCKDFISDSVWSEAVNKPYSIYGLDYTPQNIYNKNEAYLVISIEKQGRALEEYRNYKRDYNLLKTNYKNLEKFIRQFEKKFKVKKLSKIEEISENRYLVTFNTFWTNTTYKISLLTLLLRVGMFYKGGDVIEFCKGSDYDTADKYMVNGALPKILKMASGYIPAQNLNELNRPHDEGICSFNFGKAADLYESAPKKEGIIKTNFLQPMKF